MKLSETESILVDYDLRDPEGMAKFSGIIQYRLQKEFMDTGGVIPKAFVVTDVDPNTKRVDGGWHIGVLEASGDFNNRKQEWADRVRHYCRTMAAFSVFVVSEAWTTQPPEDLPDYKSKYFSTLGCIWQRLGLSLDDFPGRRELVFLQRETRGQELAVWLAEINKIQSSRILSDFKDLKDGASMTGSMVGFLPS